MDVRGNISRDELKIFLSFLLIFLLFVHWGGDNSWSRYDLTQSLAENRSVNIANDSHNTVDKLAPRYVFFETANVSMDQDELTISEINKVTSNADTSFERSSKVYSGKAPMSSFIAVPAYLIADSLTENSQDLWIREGISSRYVDLSYSTALKMLLVTLSTSILAGILLLLLLYRQSQEYVDDKTAFYFVIISGIATPIMVYSTTFFGVVLAALFGFSAYLCLDAYWRRDDYRLIILAGVFSALSFSTEYYAGIITLFLSLYIFVEDRSNLVFYIAGLAAGSLPMMVYHWVITGNPIQPPIMMHELVNPGPLGRKCTTFIYCFDASRGFVLNLGRIINTSIRLLFFPTRGIFFYSPILFLAAPGTYHIYKKNKRKVWLFPSIFFAFILFQATRLNWLAGSSFGPRYAVVGLPFLLIPVAVGLKKTLEKGKIWQIIILVLVLISAFNMLLSFGSWGDPKIEPDAYSERFTSLKPVQPSFYYDRVDNFMDTGPRSELLMSLTDRYKGLDITYRLPYGEKSFKLTSIKETDILFSTQFIPILIMAFVITAMLWNKSKKLGIFGLSVILILVLASISFSDFYISGETYDEKEINGAVNGSLSFIKYGKDEAPYIELVKQSPKKSIDITIEINGKIRNRYKLSGQKAFNTPLISKGRNKIEIKSDSCRVPGLMTNSTDYRCLSFGVQKFSTNSTKDFKKPKAQGFYGESLDEKPWMGNSSSIIFAPHEKNSVPYLEMKKISFLENSSLEFRLNGKNTSTEIKEEGDEKRIYFENKTDYGTINYLEIKSEGCAVPSKNLEGSNDDRCLSHRLLNFSTIPEDDSKNFIFMDGWHKEENSGRWMKNYSYIVSDNNAASLLDISAEPYKSLNNTSLQVFTDGEKIAELDKKEAEDAELYLEKNPGRSVIRFESSKGCLKPFKVEEESSDSRCLGFKFNDLQISQKTYGKGWYPKEGEEFTYRWMKKGGVTKIASDGGEKKLIMEFKPYKYLKGPILNISINNETVENLRLEGPGRITKRIEIPTKEGINELRFTSQTGCEQPAEHEKFSKDTRCLSFQFNHLGVQ